MKTHLFIYTFRWYNWLYSDCENNDLNFYIFLCKSNIIFEALMSFCRVLEFIYIFMCLWHTFDFMVTDRNSIKGLSTSLQWNRGLPRKGFWFFTWALDLVGIMISMISHCRSLNRTPCFVFLFLFYSVLFLYYSVCSICFISIIRWQTLVRELLRGSSCNIASPVNLYSFPSYCWF